jgi:hypothetical protein
LSGHNPASQYHPRREQVRQWRAQCARRTVFAYGGQAEGRD